MKLLKSSIIAVALVLSPSVMYAGEFLNTIMSINIGIAYGFPFGGIVEHENERYSLYSPYEDLWVKPTHSNTSFSCFADLAPFDPFILGNEAHALKIGVRGGYRLHKIRQSLVIKKSKKKEKDYSGILMGYDRWMIGPVLRYAPVIQVGGMGGNYTAIGGLTFYVLFGQYVDAELTAFPAKRKKEGKSSVSPYQSNFHGYTVDLGIGGEISAGMINIGLNVFYTYLDIDLDRNIYRDLGEKSSIHEITLEVYAGIPIEWW